MKTKKEKLDLNKITITSLNNLTTVKGGSDADITTTDDRLGPWGGTKTGPKYTSNW